MNVFERTEVPPCVTTHGICILDPEQIEREHVFDHGRVRADVARRLGLARPERMAPFGNGGGGNRG